MGLPPSFIAVNRAVYFFSNYQLYLLSGFFVSIINCSLFLSSFVWPLAKLISVRTFNVILS